MLPVGSRVLAQWHEDRFWYPGTVREADVDRLFIDFEDGAADWVDLPGVIPLTLTLGSRVEADWQNEGEYYPGEFSKQDGDRVHIAYDDGGEEWTTLARVRVTPEDGAALAAAARAEGDRVLAASEDDSYWHPGTVGRVRHDQILVRFDDGGEARVKPDQVRRLGLAVGARVEGRPCGGDKYDEGEVTACDRDRIRVRYASGEHEWTSLGMIRQRPEQAADPGVRVGSRVLARWDGGEAFYLARVTRRDGQRIHIRYDDGCEEWTTLD